MCAKRDLEYIEKRCRCEAILKKEFIAKGGIVEIDSPHYMVVEHSPWLSTWYEEEGILVWIRVILGASFCFPLIAVTQKET